MRRESLQSASMPTTLSARRKGGFRLLRYFSIASLVVIVLALIGLAYFFR